MNKSSIPNDLLRQARRKRGLTQRRLAEEVGVDEQTVRSWERGTRAPSLEFRNRLSTILEKSLEELGLQTVQVEQPSKVTPPELIDILVWLWLPSESSWRCSCDSCHPDMITTEFRP